MHRATIRVEHASGIYEVLLPEISERMPRASTRMRIDGKDLVIEVEAEDITALKASISSNLRWISAAMSARKVMEE